jgi:hypothetical protein
MYKGGIGIKAYLKPDTISLELTRWGIDVPLKLTIVFHRATLIEKLGSRVLSPGDAIRVPYNAARALLAPEKRPFDFRVMNAFDSGNFQYRWLYYTTVTELLTGDEAVKVRHA